MKSCPTCHQLLGTNGWLDIVTCSTLDGKTVEFLLPDGATTKGYFDNIRGRWRKQSEPITQEWPSPFANPVTGERPVRTHHLTIEQDFPDHVYPTHWRPIEPSTANNSN